MSGLLGIDSGGRHGEESTPDLAFWGFATALIAGFMSGMAGNVSTASPSSSRHTLSPPGY